MFRLSEPSSGQIQNTVLAHSVSVYIMVSHTVYFLLCMGSHNVCTHWMCQYYVLYLAWWWLNEPKHVAEFLILITNICCVYWPNKLLYYWSFSRLNSKQVTYRKHVNIIDLHVHRLITDPQFWKAYDSVRRYNIELYVLLDE